MTHNASYSPTLRRQEIRNIRIAIPNFIEDIRQKYRITKEPKLVYAATPRIEASLASKSILQILEKAKKSQNPAYSDSNQKDMLIENLLQMGKDSIHRNNIEKYSVSNSKKKEVKFHSIGIRELKKEIKKPNLRRIDMVDDKEAEYKSSLLQEIGEKQLLTIMSGIEMTKTQFTEMKKTQFMRRSSCVVKYKKSRDETEEAIRRYIKDHHRNAMSKKNRFRHEHVEEDFKFYLGLIDGGKISDPNRFLKEQIIFKGKNRLLSKTGSTILESGTLDIARLTAQELKLDSKKFDDVCY